LLILADDATGACDAAGAFGSSRSTLVMYGAPAEWPSDIDVLSLDLNLRDRSPGDAEQAIFAAARDLGSAHHVFVKIDSTLRGPIAALVRGALSGSAKSMAVVAPAFPEHGRLILEGRLVVSGQPGPRLEDVVGTMAETLVVDSENTDDLGRVADAARRHPEWLLVGSAGLARQLAAPVATVTVPTRNAGPLLIVAGTPAAATRSQLARMASLASLESVVVLTTPPADERDTGEAATALAYEVGAWAKHNTPRAVVLTGGATARAVCDRLGVRALRVHGELAPGIPIASLEGGVWDSLTVVTKAGGFGGPDTLLEVARALS
jgi:uncharacterized protein YgbK (DUF1537 family)